MPASAAAKTATPVVVAPREFKFTISTSIQPPENLSTERAGGLPFKSEIFTPAFPLAIAGQKPHAFVPVAFLQVRSDDWSERNGKPKKVLTAGDVRAKLNDQFKGWQEADDARKQVKLTMVNRSGKEGIEGIDEPGVSVWMEKTTA